MATERRIRALLRRRRVEQLLGNSDVQGDGVMNAADVKSLAHRYCREGVPVDLQEHQGASHEAAGAFFEPQTGAFFEARFAGAPFVNNCS